MPRSWPDKLWMYLGWPLVLVLLLLGAAAVLPYPRDQVLWAGFGTALFGLTLVRPWWFWEHPKAVWLRNLIGDGATSVFYILVALGCMYAGLVAHWKFGR